MYCAQRVKAALYRLIARFLVHHPAIGPRKGAVKASLVPLFDFRQDDKSFLLLGQIKTIVELHPLLAAVCLPLALVDCAVAGPAWITRRFSHLGRDTPEHAAAALCGGVNFDAHTLR